MSVLCDVVSFAGKEDKFLCGLLKCIEQYCVYSGCCRSSLVLCKCLQVTSQGTLVRGPIVWIDGGICRQVPCCL